MVIGDLNVACVAVFPGKADTPLIVDADTVLVFSVATEGFQMITWGNSQGFQLCRRGNEAELVQCASLNVVGKLSGVAAVKDFGRFFTTEALDHVRRGSQICGIVNISYRKLLLLAHRNYIVQCSQSQWVHQCNRLIGFWMSFS